MRNEIRVQANIVQTQKKKGKKEIPVQENIDQLARLKQKLGVWGGLNKSKSNEHTILAHRIISYIEQTNNSAIKYQQ